MVITLSSPSGAPVEIVPVIELEPLRMPVTVGASTPVAVESIVCFTSLLVGVL
jgi:hypothetical protein